jgi:hypothetical protein
VGAPELLVLLIILGLLALIPVAISRGARRAGEKLRERREEG